jgi:erythromycin esterase-like protein
MWRNHIFVEFVEWLRKENSNRVLSERVELVGMDLYSMQTAAEKLINFLRNIDLEDAAFVQKRHVFCYNLFCLFFTFICFLISTKRICIFILTDMQQF